MAQVRVRWLQRVNGRHPGEEETMERTDYTDALVAQNRLEILGGPTGPAEPAAIVGVFIDQPLSGEDLSPVDPSVNDLGQVLDEPGEDPIVADEDPDEPVRKPLARPRKRETQFGETDRPLGNTD